MEADEVEAIAHSSWLDQASAELRDMAILGASYYAHLIQAGVPVGLAQVLVVNWHTWAWEESAFSIVDDPEVE